MVSLTKPHGSSHMLTQKCNQSTVGLLNKEQLDLPRVGSGKRVMERVEFEDD